MCDGGVGGGAALLAAHLCLRGGRPLPPVLVAAAAAVSAPVDVTTMPLSETATT